MLTGDHPATALAIARELELSDSDEQIVTGPQLKQAAGSSDRDQLTRRARVFARVEPRQFTLKHIKVAKEQQLTPCPQLCELAVLCSMKGRID
jgi:hypothetical protein